MKKPLGAVLAAAMLVVAPAHGACWTAQEASAGTIRDLQSLLMVATLRCQVQHLDITADYNGFLQANKTTIQRMNDRLKAHFIKAAGPVDGQQAYDSFATSLANAYGAQGSSAEICANAAALAREAGMMAGSEEGLMLLAQRQGIATALPEGACALAPGQIVVAATAPTAVPAGVQVASLVRTSGLPGD